MYTVLVISCHPDDMEIASVTRKCAPISTNGVTIPFRSTTSPGIL